jgi:hypothetical protein
MQSVNSSVAYPLDTSCKTAKKLRACWCVWQQGKRKELAFGWPTHSPLFGKLKHIHLLLAPEPDFFWLAGLALQIFFRLALLKFLWLTHSPPSNFGTHQTYPYPFGSWNLNFLMAG